MYKDDRLSIEDRTVIVIALGSEIDKALEIAERKGYADNWLRERTDKNNAAYRKFMGCNHPQYERFQLLVVAEKIIAEISQK